MVYVLPTVLAAFRLRVGVNVIGSANSGLTKVIILPQKNLFSAVCFSLLLEKTTFLAPVKLTLAWDVILFDFSMRTFFL